jgi:hypothetical protein
MEIEREAMDKLGMISFGDLRLLRKSWKEPDRITEKWLPSKNVLRRKNAQYFNS